MIHIEIVVAGGIGDLVASMFPELVTQRQQSTRIVVPDQATAADLMATLGRAGIQVERAVALPEDPAGSTQHDNAESRATGD